MRSAINWYKRYLGWFGKHKIITAVLVVIIGIAAISSGSETNKKSTATKSTAKTSSSPAKKTTTTATKESPKRQTKGVAVTIGAGTFSGGTDVSVGLYDVTPAAGQSGNFIVNGTNSYNEILGGDSNYGGVPNVSVTLSDGDVRHISGLSEVTLTAQ